VEVGESFSGGQFRKEAPMKGLKIEEVAVGDLTPWAFDRRGIRTPVLG
jgi:hypothetical protein